MFADRLGMKYVNEATGGEYWVYVCPFCGHGENSVEANYGVYVHCDSCAADGPFYSADSGMTLEECLDGAINDWNSAKR